MPHISLCYKNYNTILVILNYPSPTSGKKNTEVIIFSEKN